MRARSDHRLHEITARIAWLQRHDFAGHLQHVAVPAQITERRSIFDQQRNIILRLGQSPLEPRQCCAKPELRADQPAAEFQRAHVTGIKSDRAVCGLNRAGQITGHQPEPPDIRP